MFVDEIDLPGGTSYIRWTDTKVEILLFCAQFSYGLPLAGKPPNGLNPLLEIYGRGKNRFPLLVLMNHPVTWVVSLPSNDVNGEDGTIQAGEYAKGDTATFFVYEDAGHVDVGLGIDETSGNAILAFDSLAHSLTFF